MKSLFLFCFISLFIAFFACNALAFRCGNDIVGRWDTGTSARAKCGNPISYSGGTERINGNIQYVVKELYNCGKNDFVYAVSISNNIIVNIEPIQRGIGKGQCK